MNSQKTLRAEKRELRQQVLFARKLLRAATRNEKSAAIKEKLLALPELQKVERVMVYINFQEEVQTLAIVEALWQRKVEVVVPLCDPHKRELHPSLLYNFDELEPGTFGVMEPKKRAVKIVDTTTIDLVIVPGLAFDRRGGRIGYGAGYYDRFFDKVPQALLIAVAFNEQVTEFIPMEEHDRIMPIIVTDKEVIRQAGEHGTT